MLESEVQKLLDLEQRLGARVVGQPEALEKVAAAIRRSRAGLSDPRRPTGSFLFLGPTGVGKTELARALAAFLFGNEEAMVRIDMSEFMERHSVARLIGAPPGYVGYDEGGHLTEAVRRRPYCVVLFDEIEKAHPEVWSILLQVLDDGRLTDGHGRTVDFRNAVLIMTSNIGSDLLQQLALEGRGVRGSGHERDLRSLSGTNGRAGRGGPDGLRARIMDRLREHFRPEFLNRIDEIILFEALGPEELREIVDIQVRRLAKRLEDRGLRLELAPEAAAELAKEGYDPVYGARPLARVIQRRVMDPLATAILAGELLPGTAVRVVYDAAADQFRGVAATGELDPAPGVTGATTTAGRTE